MKRELALARVQAQVQAQALARVQAQAQAQALARVQAQAQAQAQALELALEMALEVVYILSKPAAYRRTFFLVLELLQLLHPVLVVVDEGSRSLHLIQG